MVLRRGSKGADVKRLQGGLAALSFYAGKVDGDFGPKTETSVTAFQTAKKLLADGIAGPSTLLAYDKALDAIKADPSLKFSYTPPQEDPAPPSALMPLVTVVCDKVAGSGGYKSMRLREDAGAAYNALRADVVSLGGVITSAGSMRALSSKAGAARSRKSMHYVGLAFDLALDSGANSPNNPYLIERDPTGNGRKWIVWCRSGMAPEALRARCRELKIPGGTCDIQATFVGHRKGGGITITERKVTANVFSFTELAEAHGFERISARPVFLNGTSYAGAEWWHWQHSTNLVKGVSTFGGELQRIYPLEKCQKFIYWSESKNARYGVEWF